MIQIINVKSYEEMSKQAFNFVTQVLNKNKHAVLGLATGSTPLGLYNLMSNSDINFSKVITVNLDEYIGLSPYDTKSYCSYMNRNLFSAKNFLNNYLPDSNAEKLFDTKQCCSNYDVILDLVGKRDIQVLGLGLNGHVGFNEPGDVLSARTHIVNLSESTRQANSRFFKSIEDVPKQAITMGIADILNAKKILLLVNTPAKREILNTALLGPITPAVPASFLQLHKDVTVICVTD